MNRRSFLKLLASGVVAHELDIERLLWIPGQKTIFLPTFTSHISTSQIVALEIDRMRALFERDDLFFKHLLNEKYTITDRRRFQIPLEIKK